MAKRHTAAAAACLLLAGCLVWAGRKRTVTYLPDESAFPNAQIGYAPGVLDSGTEGATLRYLGLTWRQLEPEEGAYAWEPSSRPVIWRNCGRGVSIWCCASPATSRGTKHISTSRTGSMNRPAPAAGTTSPTERAMRRTILTLCFCRPRAAAAGGGRAAGGRRFRQLCGAGEPRPLGRVARQVRGGASLHAR